MKFKNKINKIDIAIIVIVPIVAFAATLMFESNLFVSTLLFFGVPSAYLAMRNSDIFLKSLLFAFLFSIPLSFFVDIVAALNHSWIVPYTIFPFKFFGVATVEVYVFSLLWALFVILFYEHFFDKGKRRDTVSARIKYFVLFFILLVFMVIGALLYDRNLLIIPYFFFWLGVLLVVPPVVLYLYHYPKFVSRFAMITLYFFFVTLLFEIGALAAGQWIYPSLQVIGYVGVWGYRFPIEEFVFWLVFSTPAVLSYYEFFADDRKLR